MFEALLTGALILGASLLTGQAVMVACGARGPSPVAPAAGLSMLLVVAGVAVKLPGRGATALAAMALCTAASVWVLSRGPAEGRRPRAGSIAVIAGAALLAALPFAVVGRVGILGQGLVNDDMASHLLFTEWVDSGAGDTPELIEDGYPLGPHALVGAAARAGGAGLVETFAGLTGALAVLLALTAYGALAGVRGVLRVPAALLVAFSYLTAAWLVQGAFKEPMLALAVIGFALALPALRPMWSAAPSGGEWRPRLRTALPLAAPAGIIAAGTIYNYSSPGLAWLVLAAAAWALMIALRERGEAGGLALARRLRTAAPAILVGVGIVVVAALPENVRLIQFLGFEAFSPTGEGEGGRVGFGNLRDPLPVFESLAIWPSGEFRVLPANSSTPAVVFYLGVALGLLAAGWGVVRALARRESALPAALVAAIGGYLAAVAVGTPYTSAKALMVATPILALIALRGLLAADPVAGEADADWIPGEADAAAQPPGHGRWSFFHRMGAKVSNGTPRALPLAIAAAYFVAASFSTLLVLRQPAVGPADQLSELAALRSQLDGERVLFLGRDNFIAWKLIGAEVEAPVLNHYNVRELRSFYKPTSERAKLDFDAVPTETLDEFRFVLTTDSPQRSAPPPGIVPVARTEHYVLWERTAPTRGRLTLREPDGPGAIVACDRAEGRALSELDGAATVFNDLPVSGSAWLPAEEITGGQSATEELVLDPGRWAISLQYASTAPARIELEPGFAAELEPNLLFRGPAAPFKIGEVELAARGRVKVRFSLERSPAAGRLVGAEARAFLGPVFATPLPVTRYVPLAQSCDEYVDSFRLDDPAAKVPPAIELPVAPPQDEVVQD